MKRNLGRRALIGGGCKGQNMPSGHFAGILTIIIITLNLHFFLYLYFVIEGNCVVASTIYIVFGRVFSICDIS